MQHVDAVSSLSIVFAFLTRQLNRQACEQALAGMLVPHLHQPRVEIDLRRQRRNGNETRISNGHQRCHGLIEEVGIHVRSLLQDDDVAPRPLGCAHLPTRTPHQHRTCVQMAMP